VLSLIQDLFAHQAWADSEQWRVVLATPQATSDAKLHELLSHIHAVQRFFLSAVQGAPLSKDELMKTQPLPELRASVQRYHSFANTYLSKMPAENLLKTIKVPWIPDFQPTAWEALVQLVTHSLYHRAQNAARLRQIGGEPTVTDYIVWTSKGRPGPQWNDGGASI
jgi:uncharacterized damage-inducible protein DinB